GSGWGGWKADAGRCRMSRENNLECRGRFGGSGARIRVRAHFAWRSERANVCAPHRVTRARCARVVFRMRPRPGDGMRTLVGVGCHAKTILNVADGSAIPVPVFK